MKRPDPEHLMTLLSQCALGDRNAFESLYRHTAPNLFAVLTRILKRKDWAEEALQDAYIIIWRQAGRYQPALAAPLTWMTHIARNLAIDQLRRPHIDESHSDLDMDSLSDSTQLLESFLAREEEGRLRDCLNQVDPKQRQTIALAFWHGLSHGEVALHLDLPLGTVKTWLRRGLARLKSCLEAS